MPAVPNGYFDRKGVQKMRKLLPAFDPETDDDDGDDQFDNGVGTIDTNDPR
jgi:hypothetical protein